MNKINLFELFNISLEAGREILEVYTQDFNIEYKCDDSPLTQADKRSHHLIMKALKALDPSIPILSEEGRSIPYSERRQWTHFWLVDPLDGTKEFIKKNGEFTVNIAFIEGKYPTIGVIYAPILDVFYFGIVGSGAYKLENASFSKVNNERELIRQSVRLPEIQEDHMTYAVVSRSHISEETEAFIRELEAKHGKVKLVSSGSSLKFCLVAEGRADYYPRHAPTMEWDSGAGQAIVEAAGGEVTRYKDNERVYYNKEDLLNDWFLVKRS
ncbi:3'(2'),5'-bisphosphate nucleotidase CysQ [Paenibacillus sp. NPDC057967]|uniref:3'(2'),5'-bisphosphate nucleotidase CysQ n=1 Tax=Paenibacillus sp. NPDC057967 TaxID=3346293 RepID=UPI0036D9967A